MTGEISLAEEVKTLQRHMGLFGKAFKDLSEKVKCLEERTKCDKKREIKEIIEAQQVIDEIIAVNSDAIKKLNSEIAKVQEQMVDEVEVEASTKAIEQRLVKKCRYFNRGHCRYREKCRFNHPKDICKKYIDCGKCELKNCSDRHTKACKFWSKSNMGCKRNDLCDFLHETLASDDV